MLRGQLKQQNIPSIAHENYISELNTDDSNVLHIFLYLQVISGVIFTPKLCQIISQIFDGLTDKILTDNKYKFFKEVKVT